MSSPVFRLEIQNSSGDVLTDAGNDLVSIVRARCRSWLCPHCGPWLGRSLRHTLIMQAQEWREPAMITLTVGRANWGHTTPERAYFHVTHERLVARAMRFLGVTRWVSILEPQRDGYPHWHVLADTEGRLLDYSGLHRLWRAWGAGSQVDVKRDWSSSALAINYITKYIIKRTDKYPPWMYGKKRIRLVQGSRAVGPLTGDGRGRNQSVKRVADDRAFSSRIPAVRVAECGAVLVHVERGDDGSVKRVERVPIIPEPRFYDLSGLNYTAHPVTGVRTLSVSRQKWDIIATSWRRFEVHRFWLDWVSNRVASMMGTAPTGGTPGGASLSMTD